MTSAPQPQAPLFNLRGLMISALVALVLCWPIVVTNADYVFVDSQSYLRAGAEIWDLALGMMQTGLPTPDTAIEAAPGAASDTTASGEKLQFDGEPRFGRSIAYSAFAYALLSALGPFGLAWAQGTLTLFALLVLVTPQMLQARVILIGGLLLVIAVTQLPWRVVYLMPDIFAATIVIFGACLIGPFDRLTRVQQAVLTGLACFAVATHYGNIPLAAGFLGLVLFWRLVTARLAVAPLVAAAITVAASPLANLGASVVVLDEPSTVPLRLPIVLARSIQDGPGAAYLRENCGQEDWAICDAFGDRLPESIREFLWSKDGIRAQSAEMVQRIRDEEIPLLANIFLAHPAAQTWSFVGNAVKQFLRVGQGQIAAVAGFDQTYRSGDHATQAQGGALRDAFEPVVIAATIISALALAALTLSKRCTVAERRVILAMVLGLICNAIVFGGLSAPVDRYQARVVWLVPACLVLLWAAITARQTRTTRAAGKVPDVL
ncbi:hypothetical protein [Roseobacter sinensis]|uniref:Transmembrane protein n=1 Tax=Roseobacter sinensis TaxID=2931391 RepID=A0ABT3BIL0_9RHOB|nr:hypothetical protein [Roseobacter sp. WL0113]MCV3273406.1 hypothetical protein [Roseobacter sp. WL0113]